ncbi:PIG-L family deacetylase [Mesorhizobium sp. BAC0120]|uniref:PIG-L deacetylase family protein n=1 Tax=Mesorhizobium sp. BAC0120 TaxID=3090670 RepID=UPI00298C5BE2|nr:PIG-L family deacetylase [Mesorhizobium sp. BAC0120]MDW6023579.1 PIG-L family deacetylase [Mesorhizobium sp. BAC0120]
MVVVAHPDDETVGIGGHLTALSQATIIHVTDGAPRNMRDAYAHGFATWQDYAEARRGELAAAMGEASIDVDQLLNVGMPDQEAAHNLVPLALQLAGLFRDSRPRFVCTHPFEGGHPDHDAIAFAVHAACWLTEGTGLVPPAVVEMAFYHASPAGRVYQRFLGDTAKTSLEIPLDGAALERKQKMLSHFVTQRSVLAPFDSPVERFRAAPHYNFLSLPNGGRLLYEELKLGLTGPEWLTLARAASEELGSMPR